jgi:hypothetical protein
VKRSVEAPPSSLGGDIGAAAQLLRREEPCQQVDRLDAGEDARPGALDLGQLRGEEEEERLDDHVGRLQHLDGGAVALERRVADRPDADVAVARR